MYVRTSQSRGLGDRDRSRSLCTVDYILSAAFVSSPPFGPRVPYKVDVVPKHFLIGLLNTSARKGKTLAEGLDEEGVGFAGEEFEGGVAASAGEVEGEGDEGGGEEHVGPGVEGPLAGPGEFGLAGEGVEVGNGPLVAVGSARADEVAEEMKVEADADEGGGEEFFVGNDGGEGGDEEGEADVVAEDVVVIAPEVGGCGGVAGGEIDEEAEAVEVGDDAGEGDEGAFAFVEPGGGVGDGPADEEMGDGAHLDHPGWVVGTGLRMILQCWLSAECCGERR